MGVTSERTAADRHTFERLESLEGRRLAIDSSIWLYHFQMAMRDKEGRTLSNAHILGFLWRILKLIHYGIRPIFVFDGGAPVLKRKTLSGRRQRKTGARDDHRRVAEKLLHARMREAALAHVSKGGGGGAEGDGAGNADDADGHGLGENVVYMDELAGSTGAGAASRAGDALDDGSSTAAMAAEKERELEAARKKKRDQWQKDPYALPALEQEMSSITANTSAAARKGRRGGKKPDIRFATEGELRSLLSSIQPTDLDLDSGFFRSLPAEMQYELVGDLRAASRGTSYKRLQSMLAASPTPIDFSRAQIAGLKTRNELTQKVLEVTDEIGDAHIKVPVRVAGARNREYVLIRNKGGQAGFVLGVRETGTTEEKAIAVDEDSASATTIEDDAERRQTDEEIELEDVDVEGSPVKPAQEQIPVALRNANPNDPQARRQVARELLERRARQLALERSKERGIVDEGEIMEEQLRQLRALRRRRSGGGSGRRRQRRSAASASAGAKRQSATLFRQQQQGEGEEQAGVAASDDDGDEGFASVSSDEDDDQLEADEAIDLVNALEESQRHSNVGAAADDDEALELDDVDTGTFGAADYGGFYGDEIDDGKDAPTTSPPREPDWITESQQQRIDETRLSASQPQPAERSERPGTPPSRSTTPTRAVKSGIPGLGFRMLDREGYPERLNPALLRKTRDDHDDDEEEEEGDEVDDVPVPSKGADTVISISDTESDGQDASASEMAPAHIDSIAMQRISDSREDEEGNVVNVVDFQDRPRTQSAESEEVQKEDDDKSHSREEGVANTQQSDREDSVVQSIRPESSGQRSPDEDERGNASASAADLSEEVGRNELENSPSMEDGIGFEAEQPEFDNLVSMAEEQGDVSDIRAEQAEGNREEAEQNDSRFSPDWSRSPSPAAHENDEVEVEVVMLGPDGFPLPTAAELEALDAEDEADLGQIEGDQNEFVSFLTRAKGRGLNEVRQEVQDEVNRLRSEHATTRRSEGDVTQQMAKEIQLMLRLFGLPYITAPMEAEAQCAELVAIGLADGVITDDSDVFLFGGTFIYKNMFNNKKYVECYKLSDLQHDLGMDRTKLVQLAYLLGSDYTDGLEGVGPVLAMEILSNFTGDDGLIKFRDWWIKVQTGQDTPRDTCNTTLKRIKRTLKNKVHLTDSWPDVHVLDAYYDPTVDSSDEAFQWGLPDLDSLRSFFNEYLHWDREKTDHYLIPAIEEQNRRSRRTQGTLDHGNFFDLTAGQGLYAGRQRPGFSSSRLQQVITNFRASKNAADRRQARGEAGEEPVVLSDDDGGGGEAEVDRDVPEQLLGKEMGKRSRPVVARPRQSEAGSQAEAETTGQKAGKGGKRTARAKPAAAKGKKRRNARAESESDPADEATRQQHDEEWRPRQAKPKKRKTGPAQGGEGTHIRQARNYNLDEVDNLPPSRARGLSVRAPSMSSANGHGSRQTSILISDDDGSDLSSDGE